MLLIKASTFKLYFCWHQLLHIYFFYRKENNFEQYLLHKLQKSKSKLKLLLIANFNKLC